jgi:hypothetical protein
MMHQNCSLGGIQSQDDGWGFVIRGEGATPLVALQACFLSKRNIVATRNVGFTSIAGVPLATIVGPLSAPLRHCLSAPSTMI